MQYNWCIRDYKSLYNSPLFKNKDFVTAYFSLITASIDYIQEVCCPEKNYNLGLN